MRRVLFLLFAVSVMSSVAFAQAGLGTWKGEVAGRGGGAAQEVTVVLARGANGLTGTWTQGDQETTLTEVTAEGNTVTFQRELAGRGGGGQGFTLTYNGEIEGNQLTLTQAGGGRGGAPGGGGGAPGGGAPGGGGGGAPGGGGGARGGGGRGGGGPIVLTRQ